MCNFAHYLCSYGCKARCVFHLYPRLWLTAAVVRVTRRFTMPKVLLLGATGGERIRPCDPWLCIPLTYISHEPASQPNLWPLHPCACAGCGSPALIKLLSKRTAVTAIVRSADRLPAEARGHELLTVVVVPDGHLLLSDAEMAEHMRGEIQPEIATS